MAIIHENTQSERLARLEVSVDALVREVGALRADMRTCFLWTLGILLGISALAILGLLGLTATLIAGM